MASTAPGGPAQSHKAARDPKKVKLKMTIDEVDRETGQVTAYSSKQESGDPCDDGKGNLDFKDKQKWDAAVRIEFTIRNESGCAMVFAGDPLWVAAGSQCPQGPSSQPDFEIASSGGMEMIVLDKNETSEGYGYTLRFQSAESRTGFFLLDPVILNGGGGFQMS